MSILVVLLSLLFLVTGQVFSAVHPTTSRFSTSNCNHWPIMEQDLSTVVHLRSKLECASECAKMKCYCYKYQRQTSVSRLSFQWITIETDGWLCLPAQVHVRFAFFLQDVGTFFLSPLLVDSCKKLNWLEINIIFLGNIWSFLHYQMFSPKFLHKFNVLLNSFLQKYNRPQCSKIPCLLAGIEAETIFSIF